MEVEEEILVYVIFLAFKQCRKNGYIFRIVELIFFFMRCHWWAKERKWQTQISQSPTKGMMWKWKGPPGSTNGGCYLLQPEIGLCWRSSPVCKGESNRATKDDEFIVRASLWSKEGSGILLPTMEIFGWMCLNTLKLRILWILCVGKSSHFLLL